MLTIVTSHINCTLIPTIVETNIIMILKNTITYLAIITTLMGCTYSREEKEIRKSFGKELCFPQDLSCVYADTIIQHCILSNETSLPNSFKIVTYIDENLCSECALKILYDWNNLIDSVCNHKDLIIICHSIDKQQLKENLINLRLSNRILVDNKDCFLINNKIDNNLSRNRTFLINNENRIILVGEPIKNPSLSSLYKKKIHSITEKR